MAHDADYLFALKLQEELNREAEGEAAAAPQPPPVSISADWAILQFENNVPLLAI